MGLLPTIRHLLPRGPAWNLSTGKNLTKFFEAIADSFDPLTEYFCGLWREMWPDDTTQLTTWEEQFGLPLAEMTTAQRRARLTGKWRERGGQSPHYLQSVIQAAGYPLYVHDWWVPGTVPPEVRDPFFAMGGGFPQCGDGSQCGDGTQCGYINDIGYALANKLYRIDIDWDYQCGDGTQCGDGSQAGSYTNLIYVRLPDVLPYEPEGAWRRVAYVGGATWPDILYININQKENLEDLLLRIFPADVWIVLLVDYVSGYIIEDESGDYALEDESGDYLLEDV